MFSTPFAPALPLLALVLALGTAVWHDMRIRRIPNTLIIAGTLGALLLHLMLQPGDGLFSDRPGSIGVLAALAGFGAGLCLLMPFYALRTLGAGDVKLMAMIGAFVGPRSILEITLLTMLAGGLLAITVALWTGQLKPVLRNLRYLLRNMFSHTLAPSGSDAAPAPTTGKLPYAIAIASGTVVHLAITGPALWSTFN